MGNCVFKTGSKIPSDDDDGHEMLIKVVTPNGGVMELNPPITADSITNEFPGHAIYHPLATSSPRQLHHEELLPGHLYHLLPLIKHQNSYYPTAGANTTPFRMSFSNKRKAAAACRGDVWKVRLVITAEQLAEILAQEQRTEELVESVRMVAKCGSSNGALSNANSVAAESDKWSVDSRSSWKGFVCNSRREDN